MSIRFIIQKIFRALLTLWLVVTFVFIVLRISGDPVEAIMPEDTPIEIIEQMRIDYGLDKPIWKQYIIYFGNITNGNMGTSFLDGRDAVEVVFEKIPKTAQLGLIAFLLWMIIGLPAGIFAALNRNKAVDRFIMTISVSGYSLPNFFLGILLIMVFSMWFRILPSAGSGTLKHMIMPAITLGTAGAGVIARFTRSAMLEVLGQSYIRAAQAKGMPWNRILWRDALPNASIPIVTVVGFMVGALVGGSIVTETVFSWPGVGRTLIEAVSNRDLAVVQVGVLLIATSMVVVNFTVDLAYSWLDPRIRSARKGEN
jgi:peptide/nickel transport system permease protein